MGIIGVLDSGIGGMELLRHLMKRYPQQDFIFLADQIHSPYGLKSETELIEIVNHNLAWLKQQGAESILFACNTISSLCEKHIDAALPIQRIIAPTCAQMKEAGHKRILVAATPFTAASGSYQAALKKVCPDAEIMALGLPYLCSDIENMIEPQQIKEKLRYDLKPYSSKADAVVLGCTHYPLVKAMFEELLQIPVYDSNSIVLKHASDGSGKVLLYTSADPHYFDQQCHDLFQMDIHSMKMEHS